MNNPFLKGFLKTAQVGVEDAQAQPEEPEKETVVTCLSGCQYAQNPEKRCMLESVTFSQGEDQSFTCGQFMEVQPTMVPQAPEQPMQSMNAKKVDVAGNQGA